MERVLEFFAVQNEELEKYLDLRTAASIGFLLVAMLQAALRIRLLLTVPRSLTPRSPFLYSDKCHPKICMQWGKWDSHPEHLSTRIS